MRQAADYVKAGKESDGVVSAFDQFEYKDEAPFFRKLAENFELCVFGLNVMPQLLGVNDLGGVFNFFLFNTRFFTYPQ